MRVVDRTDKALAVLAAADRRGAPAVRVMLRVGLEDYVERKVERWRAVHDPALDRMYYVNDGTQARTWDKPSGFDTEDEKASERIVKEKERRRAEAEEKQQTKLQALDLEELDTRAAAAGLSYSERNQAKSSANAKAAFVELLLGVHAQEFEQLWELRGQLEVLELSELGTRAAEAGVEDAKCREAGERPDAQAAFVELLLDAHTKEKERVFAAAAAAINEEKKIAKEKERRRIEAEEQRLIEGLEAGADSVRVSFKLSLIPVSAGIMAKVQEALSFGMRRLGALRIVGVRHMIPFIPRRIAIAEHPPAPTPWYTAETVLASRVPHSRGGPEAVN